MTIKKNIQKRSLYKLGFYLSVAAAVQYSSWIFGFIINSKVISSGTASELAASNQPYYTVFITSDIITAVLISGVAVCAYKLTKSTNAQENTVISIALFSYLAFGIFTALSAVVPLTCAGNSGDCSVVLNNSYYVHNFLGMLASACLFISTVLAVTIRKSKDGMMGVILGVLAFWVALGVLSFLVSASAVIPGHIFQKGYLILAALLIYLIPSVLPIKQTTRIVD